MKFRKKPAVTEAHQFKGSSSHVNAIKGVKGEPYPCKPDILAATYDKVEDTEHGIDSDGQMTFWKEDDNE